MDWEKILGKSLVFSLNPKRWIQPFLLDSSLCLVMVFYWLNLNFFSSSISSMVLFFLLVFITIVFYILLNVLINGAIVHQSCSEKKNIKASYKISNKKYLSLFASAMVVGIICGFVVIVPYIGFIFSILVSMAFFFIYQGIIIKDLKLDKTLEHSGNIFKKKWASTIILWLILELFIWIMIGIFSLPLVLFLVSAIIISGFTGIIEIIYLNMLLVIASVIILFVGISVSRVFSIKAKTEFYLQLVKKHSFLEGKRVKPTSNIKHTKK
ncbi:MAG: hypothetical protein KAU95_04010 [Candidatus Aenigmarchaeota archaeon]|nr:hypothetical protein [Candidatus Aenigmarchaeota archaeon]